MTEWPLALCDFTSVDSGVDLKAVDQVKPLKGSKPSDNAFVEIESYVSFYNPQHVWCYLDSQAFDEGWLFKLYDSRDGVAKRKSFFSKL